MAGDQEVGAVPFAPGTAGPQAGAPTAVDWLAHHRFWPKRLPKKISQPQTTLWHNLAVSALRFADKPALVFFDQVMTYRELMQQAERLAAHLAAKGVQTGDRVMLLMQNCPQWVVAHFAILRANAVVVPVNPMNKRSELLHVLRDADVRCALVAEDLAPELLLANQDLPEGERLAHLVLARYADAFGSAAELPEAWRGWLLGEAPALQAPPGLCVRWGEALGCEADLPPLLSGPQDMAALPYTSGTTGQPKGCIHTHASLMHNAVASALWGNSSADNITLLVVPMFHITGMVSGLHAGIYTGATLVVMPRWERDLAGRLISGWRITHWTNIPTMVIDLLASPAFDRFDLSSLVYIGGGGAAMPQAVAERLWRQFGLRYCEGYGLTETAAPSHSNPPDAPKQQCLGIPFMGNQARIIDPETGLPVAPGQVGEIAIHGPNVFAGYWKCPEASAAAFIDIDGLRFFRSGDLGRVDADGYYFLTDRLKRMINASGFKVWPAEVEALMFAHPDIAEACVVSSPDAYRGETVKAVVVLRAEAQGRVGAADLIAWCRGHMAAYKCPRLIELVDALPKSGSGKVLWRSLQEREWAGQEATP